MRGVAFGVAMGLLPVAAGAQPVALGARVERDGVSVAFLAGPEVRDVASDTWRATVQGVGDREIVVRVSRSEEYRGRRDEGARRRVRACGRDAERVVIETAEMRATPSFLQDEVVVHGPESVTPATTEVRLELEHRGLPIWISWVVRSDRRARHRAVEDAFFRSVQCTTGPMLGAPAVRDGVGVPFLRDVAVEDLGRGAARQRVGDGDEIVILAQLVSRVAPGERLLLQVCGRQVDYRSATVGDRTESEVRVPSGRRGRWMRISWSVPTDRRATWKWLEDSFFAAITCL